MGNNSIIQIKLLLQNLNYISNLQIFDKRVNFYQINI